MQVVTLRYIPAAEMQKILEPLASPDAFVRVDPNRNMLVLAGTSSELANLMATIKTFDVDVLKGMSVGLVPGEKCGSRDGGEKPRCPVR